MCSCTPQSIIHGMVEFSDRSVIAQLGSPDMRTPIAHCLGWPDRIVGPAAKLDLAQDWATDVRSAGFRTFFRGCGWPMTRCALVMAPPRSITRPMRSPWRPLSPARSDSVPLHAWLRQRSRPGCALAIWCRWARRMTPSSLTKAREIGLPPSCLKLPQRHPKSVYRGFRLWVREIRCQFFSCIVSTS